MKIVFVSSGSTGLSPIIIAQAVSLRETGLHVKIFPIIGKGFWGYLRNLPRIRKQIKEDDPNIIHAHYLFCGIVASIATKKPVITSLMGSDVKSSGLWRFIIRFFAKRVWNATIVKSIDMKKSLGVDSGRIHVIANGVDFETFKPMDRIMCREKLGWRDNTKVVLFAADPERHEKNFGLAKQSFHDAGIPDAELKVVFNVSHEDIPLYLCAADVVLLTSKWEGSPNIVKEAMACNVPIVSTDVGDVRQLAKDIDSIWVCRADSHEIAVSIREALYYSILVDSRCKLIDSGLDSGSVATRIVRLYMDVENAR